MKRTMTVLSLAFLFAWTSVGLVEAGDYGQAMESHRHGHSRDDSLSAGTASSATQRLCPLTGQPVDRSQFVDHEGKRIYFCCAACKEPFRKDPAKYIQAMESAGVILEKVPER
jgi:YHS domain-containing protein